MKLLVTGIAGFIGSHLAERLVSRGDEIIGIDNFDPFYERKKKENNLAELRSHVELIEGDITDRGTIDAILARGGFDAVVHLAALAGVRPSIARPARYQHVNVVGTTHLAESMVAHGVNKLVFASSSSVYGNSRVVPYEETQRVDQPASPYAVSKRACELLLHTFSQIHGLSIICLRYFTVFGPRQRPEMAIHKFSRLIEEGEPVILFGNGQSRRDYTYIDDIVDGTVGAIGAIGETKTGFSIYNLGGTNPVRLDDLVARIGEALGKAPIIEHQPDQPGDVRQTWACVDAARRDLGYQPKIDLGEGLRRFVQWLRGEVRW